MSLQESIVKTARSYLGKLEKTGNRGFIDAIFEKKMRNIGWKTGESWCAYFAELVIREAAAAVGREDIRKVAEVHCSGSSLLTLQELEDTREFTRHKNPQPGDIVIFRMGKSQAGHTGIVVAVEPNGWFRSVEGNTGRQGERDGTVVGEKRRLLNQAFKPRGLNIVGFLRAT